MLMKCNLFENRQWTTKHKAGLGLWVLVVDFYLEFADGWDPDARVKISKAFYCKTLLNNNQNSMIHSETL